MIIGRNKEMQILREAYDSEYSEFVAVYGRRRVGKTFLIRETFNYTFTFQHSGLANELNRKQIAAFRSSLMKQGLGQIAMPKDWYEAFDLLELLIKQSEDKKKVVFIDEMPWMDAKNSHLVSALEHFWNSFASSRQDVLLIICGSATSWMVNNVFRNHGGLHNRVTRRIHLHPFCLHECELYSESRGMAFSRYEILLYYMVAGGVPYYWSSLQRGLSVDQNVDNLFFNRDGELYGEFGELYASLFSKPEGYIKVIEALATKRIGLTRNEIVKEGGMASSGRLTNILSDLESCDFIRSYVPFGAKKHNAIYQLTDSYTLFYFKYLKKYKDNDAHFWTNSINTAIRNSWQGLAFEQVCFAHIQQIKQALGIGGVSTNICSWRVASDDELGDGAQIDMLIDRADNVINICEIKFSDGRYVIDKDVNASLKWKRSRFVSTTRTKKSIHLTMVTIDGLANNKYSGEIQSQVTSDDLFKE